MNESVLIVIYLANIVFLLRFITSVITQKVFEGVNIIYSIIFLILTYGTILFFNFKLFIITLILGLVVFGIIRFYADKIGMRQDNSDSKRSIIISITGLIIVFIGTLFINNI
tara:strand:+ start:337 stop:672 length:336 start_codon:yes stop_codon:yes gene_type:complete